jgi:nucleotide-binding universal stress UspA family protein
VSQQRLWMSIMFKKILLATHGTKGAQAAEDLSVELAREQGATLLCIHVVNEDWKWMTGDDWLNTSASRNRFARHVEDELAGEAEVIRARVAEKAAESSVPVAFEKTVGNPGKVILEAASGTGADLIVMGSRQKRQDEGFKSRISWDKLFVESTVPIILAPPVG